MKRLTLVVLSSCLAMAAPAGADIPAGNLIVNPGAEVGAAANDSFEAAKPPGAPWGTGPRFTQVAYGASGTNFPTTQVAGSIGGGSAFFAGGRDDGGGFTDVAYQEIDVSGAATEIDAGGVSATLTAYLGGTSGQADNAVVFARFDSGDQTFGSVSVGPVTDSDRGGVTTLLKRSAQAPVPAGTRTIRIQITATRIDGTYDDAYADNLSLSLAGPLPPGTPPDTAIDSGPPGQTNDSTPTFTFASNTPGATFECRVDADGFTPCTSPYTTIPLPDGAHGFDVRAVIQDGGGLLIPALARVELLGPALDLPDPEPAHAAFIVDTVAPQTTITAGPADRATVPPSPPPTYRFESSEPGSTFTCHTRLLSGGVGQHLPCTSPAQAVTSVGGNYQFEVWATDAAGNVDNTRATRIFQNGPPDTTITSGPQGTTWFRAQTFEFTATAGPSTFRCRNGSSPWFACRSPVRTPTLASGASSSFAVYAVGPAGAPDPTPAERTFTIARQRDVDLSCRELIPLSTSNRFREASTRCGITEPCPLGARCTSSGTVEEFDDDSTYFGFPRLHVSVTAGFRSTNGCGNTEIKPDDPTGSRSGSPYYNTHHCSASAAGGQIGGGLPAAVVCDAHSVIVTAGSGTGDPDKRYMTCKGDLRVEPTTPLALVIVPLVVVQTQFVQLAAPSGGRLSVTASLFAAAGSVHASATRRPRIAPFSAQVGKAGPVTVRLKLNRAAMALLRRKGKLRASLRVTFTPRAGGATLRRTAKLTLKPPRSRRVSGRR